MKLKILAVITLMVSGCSLASAQIGTFTFYSATGGFAFCDFLVITVDSGGVVAGYDDLTTVCNQEFNAPIVGFDASTPDDGQPAWGKGIIVGDAIYDASADTYTGQQFTRWLSHKASRIKKGHFTGPYSWMAVAGSYTGFYFGDNYGFLAAGPPKRSGAAGHGTTAGSLPKALRK